MKIKLLITTSLLLISQISFAESCFRAETEKDIIENYNIVEQQYIDKNHTNELPKTILEGALLQQLNITRNPEDLKKYMKMACQFINKNLPYKALDPDMKDPSTTPTEAYQDNNFIISKYKYCYK